MSVPHGLSTFIPLVWFEVNYISITQKGYHLIRNKTTANAISELEDRDQLYLQTSAFVGGFK
jgi:hypothetical protein